MMGNKILICGLNDTGKSTLGKSLAAKLNYELRDIEDYCFMENNAEIISQLKL